MKDRGDMGGWGVLISVAEGFMGIRSVYVVEGGRCRTSRDLWKGRFSASSVEGWMGKFSSLKMDR